MQPAPLLRGYPPVATNDVLRLRVLSARNHQGLPVLASNMVDPRLLSADEVGRCTLTPPDTWLKGAWFQSCTYQVKTRFRTLPFKCNLHRYNGAEIAAVVVRVVPRVNTVVVALPPCLTLREVNYHPRPGGVLHVGIKLTHNP
jgi:hypothetical protein